MSVNVEPIEQRLAEHRAELATIPPLLEAAERELAAAQSRLDNAQLIHDAAAAAWAMAADQLQGSGAGAAGPWSPRSAEQERDAEEAHRASWAAYSAARDEFTPLLIARNEADKMRANLVARQRFLQGQIEAGERELEQARQAAAPGRDLLGDIRRRLGLGGPRQPAA